jgi:hypothetical protein
MVTHFKLGGHLACGREGKTLKTSTDSGKVTCRNCRHTDAYVEARQAKKDASAAAAQPSGNWRDSWGERLADMPGPQRLPRGFDGQLFV